MFFSAVVHSTLAVCAASYILLRMETTNTKTLLTPSFWPSRMRAAKKQPTSRNQPTHAFLPVSLAAGPMDNVALEAPERKLTV